MHRGHVGTCAGTHGVGHLDHRVLGRCAREGGVARPNSLIRNELREAIISPGGFP